MKKAVNLTILVIVAVLTGCSGKPRIRVGFNYPEMLSPIYYLDTFQIQKPLVVYIDSIPYITSEEVFDNVENKTDLPKTRGVVRYLTGELDAYRSFKYSLIYKEPRSWKFSDRPFDFVEENIKLLDSIQGVAVYRFDRKPRTFLLALIATEWHNDPNSEIIFGAEFSNDYMLAIAPLFPPEAQ